MPLPAGVETVTVSSGVPLALPNGTWFQGRILFTAPDLAVVGEDDLTFGGTVVVDLVDGQFTVGLVATNATGMDPHDWTYTVTSEFTNAPNWVRYITLPKAAPSVKLADVLVPDPVAGTYSVLVNAASLGLGNAATKNVGQVAGTVAAGDDPRFGGGGGSTIRTASVRITDDNLSGLPSAPTWAKVLTSAGTPLQCSIAAAAGDRIRVYGRYMHSGTHFMDWVLLSSGGAIAVYAGTDTSSPLSEGDPAMYPSLSFSYEPGPPMFTVGSGHISGGLATVALAHQGTGAGLVYAHTTYPWRLRLENIGPEPA